MSLHNNILVLGDHQVFRLAINEELDLATDLKYKGRVSKHNEVGSGKAQFPFVLLKYILRINVTNVIFDEVVMESVFRTIFYLKYNCKYKYMRFVQYSLKMTLC